MNTSRNINSSSNSNRTNSNRTSADDLRANSIIYSQATGGGTHVPRNMSTNNSIANSTDGYNAPRYGVMEVPVHDSSANNSIRNSNVGGYSVPNIQGSPYDSYAPRGGSVQGAAGPGSTYSAGPGSAYGAPESNYGGTIINFGKEYEADNKSIISATPSRISKLTYSEYPQIRPTNPLYASQATFKTGNYAASHRSRASTMNTVSRRQKYDPSKPRRISDWRWVAGLSLFLFFPTGILALGLAIKARTKFNDGFIDESKKLNKRAFWACMVTFFLAMTWILTMFFLVDKWPRTNG